MRTLLRRSKDKAAGVSGGPQWGGAIVRAVETSDNGAHSDSPARRTLARINRQGPWPGPHEARMKRV